jgi:ectoine hydroxylase-related dioxygenase (phytanoyl-CoA dioxygenase family)
MSTLPSVTEDAGVAAAQAEAFRSDGAVFLPGLFRDWVDDIAAGIEQNMREPGPYAAENLTSDESGRFFDDYCNWRRIPAFGKVIRESALAEVSAQLMQSRRVQFFHEHVLVKEPGTDKATPWHQDAPYYFVDGADTVSFWVPIDPVDASTLRLIAGSHHWEKFVLPTRWLSNEDFYAASDDYLPVPDPDAEPGRFDVLEWSMEPGDAVAFHYRTVHGARGNLAKTRRRALSMRVVGDDARYVSRPGPTSPPFPGHGMREGEVLREDWFPVLAGE